MSNDQGTLIVMAFIQQTILYAGGGTLILYALYAIAVKHSHRDGHSHLKEPKQKRRWRD